MAIKLLTAREVADHLQVGRRTVSRLVASGELRPLRITPRTVRYSVEDVDALLRRARER
ncbi:MAG TPA: helix-turn-helix domain-containing protein [Gaiellaceae bacterium]|nr:helix-turn-helix domain-containing protein [Gaiellaceae bacterium]